MGDPIERLCKVKDFGEYGGVNASVEISTTFTVLNADTLPAIFQGTTGPNQGCYVYGRSFNPTVRALARQLAALEDTEAAYATSSGMAAISASLMALCNAGDHIVASNTVYGGTFALLKSFLPVKCNITTTFVDITDLEAVAAAITPNTKVIYTESVSNPTLVVAPLQQLAVLSHQAGAKLVVDNTFTPCIITPSHWGADVVVHSMTKFVSGASDIIAGAICSTAAFIESLMHFHTGPLMLLGPTMDPHVASQLSLRLPHLGLRMQEHSRRALAMAQRLHALGAKVNHPGLPGHPQHALLQQLANRGYGLGGLLGVDLGSKAAADAFMERLQNKHAFGLMAVSLGYFDTLMSASAASTSSELEPTELAASGIQQGYVRISVGLTGTLEQRLSQLEEAYQFIARGGAQAPYRAVKVQRLEGGSSVPLLSWPSMGSETCLDGDDADDLKADEVASTALTTTYPIMCSSNASTEPAPPTRPALLHPDSASPVDSNGDNSLGCCTTAPPAASMPNPFAASTAVASNLLGASTSVSVHAQAAGTSSIDAAGVEGVHSAPPLKVRRLSKGVDIVYQPNPKHSLAQQQ